MGLYIGSTKIKITLDNIKYFLNLYSSAPIVNNVLLLSSDNYILKDSNNLYLTAKENE